MYSFIVLQNNMYVYTCMLLVYTYDLCPFTHMCILISQLSSDGQSLAQNLRLAEVNRECLESIKHVESCIYTLIKVILMTGYDLERRVHLSIYIGPLN